ncbi:MAG: PAS domain-containing protein, partial [Cytophagales bacterium]|nr:PAS domain-containing protein [Cytophagales bacterium]
MRAYASFLLDHHLDELATRYLLRLRTRNASLLARLAHLSEADTQAWARGVVGSFLRLVAAGSTSPGVPGQAPQGEALRGADAVAAHAACRQVLVQFLPRYTGDPDRLVALVEELDEWHGSQPPYVPAARAENGREPLPGEPAPLLPGRHGAENGLGSLSLYETLDAHQVQKIVDTVPALLYIMEMPSAKTFFINGQVRALLGYSPEEIVAMGTENIARLIHPEDQAAVAAHHQALSAAADGQVLEIEYRIRHRDGEWRWFRSFETVFRRDPQGVVWQLLGNALDVSGRKEARDALGRANRQLQANYTELEQTQTALREWNTGLDQRVKDRTLELKEANQQIARLLGRERYVRAEAERQKEQLNTLFLQSPALISIVRGPQFRYELANPPYLLAVGATGSIEGKTVREVIRDLDQAVWDVLDGVYTTGRRFVGNEFPITADWQGDGRPYLRYFNLVYEPLRDPVEKVSGIITFGYEVTDQVLARRTVEESERRIRRILDGIPEIIWTADPAGVNTFFNKTWYEYAGQTPGGEVQAISDRLIHPHDFDLTRRKWQLSLDTGVPFETEYRLRKTPEGEHRWVLA